MVIRRAGNVEGKWILAQVKVPYAHKECYVIGDESRMQNTIDFWWGHINAKVYERYQEHFVGRICDIGCNIGMSSLLAANDPRVRQVVGVDIYDKAIEAAHRYARFAGLDDKVEYIVHDFTEGRSCLGTESFDSVISFHALEHIYPDDLDMFVAHLRRILKMCGKVLISIPYMYSYDSPEHASYFNKSTLRILFNGHGFDILDIRVLNDVDLVGLFVKSAKKATCGYIANIVRKLV